MSHTAFRARWVLSALFAAMLACAVLFAPVVAMATGLPGDPYEPNDTTSTATHVEPDGVDHIHYCDAGGFPEYGADYLTFDAVAGELYAVTVWSQDYYGFWGTASVTDASGRLLAQPRTVYGSVKFLQSQTFWVSLESGGPMFLAFTGMGSGSLVPYHVTVARHDRPVITGTVRRTATGAPVAGAQVQAWIEPGAFEDPAFAGGYASTTTRADGTYSLTIPKPGNVGVRFDDASGVMAGEWYRSSMLRATRSVVRSLEDSVAAGVDATLVDLSHLAVRMVRTDTGEPVPGLAFSALTFETDAIGSEYIDGTVTDANGVSTVPALDPRRSYRLLPMVRGKGLVPRDLIVFTPTPGEVTTVTVWLMPPHLVTVTDALPLYRDSASINISASGNVDAWATFWNLDGSGWCGGGLPLSVGEPGRHTLSCYSTDVYGNDGPLTDVVFSVVAPTTCTLETSPAATPAYGKTYTLTAFLRRTLTGQPVVPGETLRVEKSADGKTGWVTVASLSTSTSGEATWSVTPKAATYYRIRYPGRRDWYESATSSSVRLGQSKATVYTPIAPSIITRDRVTAIYGYVAPKHSSGTYLAVLMLYKRNSAGKYVYHHSIKAKRYYYSSSKTKYRGVVSLPHRGKWRVRAVHSDDAHTASYSGYEYFTVR